MANRLQVPRRRTVACVALAVTACAALFLLRGSILRTLGGLLIVDESVQQADVIVITPESGPGGVLETGDLFLNGIARTVGLLTPAPDRVDDELTKRGVNVHRDAVGWLVELGVPLSAIVQIAAGEGGTTESTLALVQWAASRRAGRVMVIVGPTHARRYRRALRRVWPVGLPAPIVHSSRYSLFRADDWWRLRRTRREGIFELQKLALDYVAHPF